MGGAGLATAGWILGICGVVIGVVVIVIIVGMIAALISTSQTR